MSGRLDVQFLSVNHNKYIPYPELNKSGKMTGNSGNASTAPRSAKSLHTFDLLSISDQLPPNTGPAGTVPVNGSNSGNTPNKNLSHVPCKFFRQGNCQAGNSCPFSHNLDGTLAADKLPCKYFQKGNCKFGLKCALAHFLPDGTRVNNKGLLYRRNDRGERGDRNIYSERGDRNIYSERGDKNVYGERGDRSNYYANYGSSQPSVSHINTALAPPASSQYVRSASASSSSATTPVSQPIDISANLLSHNGSNVGLSGTVGSTTMPLSSSSHVTTQTQTPTGFRSSSGHSLTLGSASSFTGYSANDWLVSNTLTSNPFSSAGPKLNTSSMMRSLSSNSPPNFMASPVSGEFNRSANSEFSGTSASAFHSPQTQFSTPYSKFRLLSGILTSPQYNFLSANDSAVVDDESEDESNAFYEDFVPASLGNLILTPQEKQRRDSRSQSGTLLVRPNILSSGLFDKRTEKKQAGGDYVFMME